MKIEKKLGIFMDHENAHLIEYHLAPSFENDATIKLNHFTKDGNGNGGVKGENLIHNKEQHKQNEFYHQLGNTIRNYDSVLLFGPTEAKTELSNIIKDNHLFDKIQIFIESADKMSDNQQHTFVSDYFRK